MLPGMLSLVKFGHVIVELCTSVIACRLIGRVSYIRISLLFLFPVKDGKLSTGVNATFDASTI